MPLTVHHLGKSQSERIVWLCEELAIPYNLVVHDRNPETALAPDSIKALHPAGTAPVMVDDPAPTADGGKVVLAESGAIVEYINAVHAAGRLALTPADKGYAQYLEWLHFANGSLQATISRMMIISRVGGDDKPFAGFIRLKWDTQCAMIEQRLSETHAFLAGPALTLADIMTVFSLTTMRGFKPVDLGAYPEILAYLKRIGERDAYKKAMEKGDPGLKPMLGATVEGFVFGKK